MHNVTMERRGNVACLVPGLVVGMDVEAAPSDMVVGCAGSGLLGRQSRQLG